MFLFGEVDVVEFDSPLPQYWGHYHQLARPATFNKMMILFPFCVNIIKSYDYDCNEIGELLKNKIHYYLDGKR